MRAIQLVVEKPSVVNVTVGCANGSVHDALVRWDKPIDAQLPEGWRWVSCSSFGLPICIKRSSSGGLSCGGVS